MARLIGRGEESALLAGLLTEAANGAGRLVALTGEAGAGTTLLATECLRTAQEQGFLVLRGDAHDDGRSYAPIIAALRPLAGAEPTGELARLFGTATTSAPAPLEDPALQRTRLFEAVTALVATASATQPLVLLVDDIDRADTDSLDVLRHLGHAAPGLRCLVIVTCRSCQLPGFVEVPVRPLPPAAVAELAKECLGDSAPPALLDLLAAKAGGVPLFVRELIGALLASGDLFLDDGWVLRPGATAPSDLFAARVSALDPADRAVLEAVVVYADAATSAQLAARFPAVAVRLERLRANGFVTTDGSVFRAAHPLLADAVYASMPARTRQSHHAGAAAAVDDVSTKAHHLAKAGAAVPESRALTVFCAAAEHAVLRRAGAAGMRHAKSAIALARRLDRDDLVPGLLARLAESASYAGRVDESVAAWRAAAATGDRVPCLLRLAQVETDNGQLADATGHLSEAALMVGPADVELRVDVAQVGLVLHSRAGATADARAAVAELTAIAEQTGNRRATALARYGLGTDAAIRDVSTTAGVPVAVTLELTTMATAIGRGEHAAVARRAERGVQLAEQAGLPPLAVLPTALWALAQFQVGAWDNAIALADRARELAHRTDHVRGTALALAVRATVLAHRGETHAATSCVDEADTYYRGRRIGPLLDLIRAQLALSENNPEEAVRLTATPAQFLLPVTHFQVRAEACRRTGDSDEATRMADELAKLGFPYACATADRLRGGPALLTSAATALDALALPFEAATCRLALAEEQPTPTAITTAQQALRTFDALGATPHATAARALLRTLG